jgi:hypothetical protein
MARNTEKIGKCKCSLWDLEYCVEKLQSWKMRNVHMRTWNMVRNTEKRGKWGMFPVVAGLWREN